MASSSGPCRNSIPWCASAQAAPANPDPHLPRRNPPRRSRPLARHEHPKHLLPAPRRPTQLADILDRPDLLGLGGALNKTAHLSNTGQRFSHREPRI